MKPEDKEHLAERWLNAGLKELGHAEPRAGLEARILANLHAEAAQRNQWWRQWWPGFAVAVALALIGSVALLTRSAPKPRDITAATSPAQESRATQVATPTGGMRTQARTSRPKLRTGATTPAVMASPPVPRLDQFPSPQPLSEQEKLLARYVEERPQEAAVVARMRAQFLKEDMLEFESQNPAPEESQDRKQ